MTSSPEPLMRRTFAGADGLTLAADVGGDPAAPPVILLHGGGQTRRSWGAAAATLIERGHYVISLDLRGHGESEWASNERYDIRAFADDLLAVVATTTSPPVLVGASLGGLAALVAVGESGAQIARGLVLVDIAPRADREGAAKISAFMGSAPDGFASLEEAAGAVAAYLPHRKTPPSGRGLAHNLRQRDGRYYWHWDPAFLRKARDNPAALNHRYEAAALKVRIPTLLIRGAQSEIVNAAAADHLGQLIPHARCVTIAGAHHMVAGDRNDAFNEAVFAFLGDLQAVKSPSGDAE
ncbi:MAG: hypothetical protein JWP35_2923 [Caulobacter sp.]|nr:hypothetical protein [Caulobacter sp.]